MLRNRAKRKYGTVAQKIQFLGFYRTAIILFEETGKEKVCRKGIQLVPTNSLERKRS